MIRWWDDPEAAAGVLGAVDGSDVVQGVGTAVLGYHAIAKAALAPLVSETLVDPAGVWEVLGGLDLEPVAKALGAATEPVMGPASARYGQLLAADIHEQAQAGLETLMAQLGATGIPMPWVVERAVEVVGVPPRHLGGYSKVAKERVVAPVVRQDAADRALMEFASRLGQRESAAETGDAVVKAFDVEFEEDEHPRDQLGRFAVKQERPARSRRERMAAGAAARDKRRASLAAARQAPAQEAAPPSLASLARALASPVETVRARETRRRETRAAGGTRSLSQMRARPAPAAPTVLPHEGYDPATATAAAPAPPNRALNQGAAVRGATHTVTFTDPARAATFLAPIDLAEAIANNDGWTTPAPLDVSPNGTSGVWANRLHSPDPSLNLGMGLAGFEIRGIVPLADDDGKLTYTIPAGTRLRVVDQVTERTTYPSPNPAFEGDVPVFNTFILEVVNPEDYADLSNISLSKAVEQWNVGGRPKLVAVERNEEGEFAEQAVSAAPFGRDTRRKRMARASAARAKSQARRASMVAGAEPATPLKDMATRSAAGTRSRSTRSRGTRSATQTRSLAQTRALADSQQRTAARADAPQALFMTDSEFTTAMGGDKTTFDYMRGAIDASEGGTAIGRIATASAGRAGTVDAVEAFTEHAVASTQKPKVVATVNSVDRALALINAYSKRQGYSDGSGASSDDILYDVVPSKDHPGRIDVTAQRFLGHRVAVVGSPEAVDVWQVGGKVRMTTLPPVGGLAVIEDRYGLPPGAFDGKTDGVVVVHVELPHDGSQR